jgi:ketosteroid isomerase-like protein
VTRDDLAVVSRMFEGWAAGDLEAMLECADPDLEWHAAVDGRFYRGHEGVREFFARRREEGRLEIPLQRTVEVAPGRVLAVGRLRLMRPGRGLADSPGVWAFYVSDGRITRIEGHPSEREAIAALRAVTPV